MVVNQPFGIGDILFLEPLFRYYWKKNGEKPIVPVRDHFMWISGYIESAYFVPMSHFKIDYESMRTNDRNYLPARFANQIYRNLGPHDHSDIENMMLDKYRLAYQFEKDSKASPKLFDDPMMWKDLRIAFDERQGKELMDYLSIAPNEKYILVNEHCGVGSIEINPVRDYRTIKMCSIPGFTMLDWYYVMMNAYENHHVSTSTFYVFQAMENAGLKVRWPIYFYPRPNIDGLRGISLLKPDFDYIFVKNL